MGRYFQHTAWPGNAFELTGAPAQVPQSPIAFHSSGGVHLIVLAASIENATAGPANIFVRARLDGTSLATIVAQRDFATGEIGTLLAAGLLEIPTGPHTLDAEARGTAAPGDSIMVAGGLLAAIEFPSWETSDRIEGP